MKSSHQRLEQNVEHLLIYSWAQTRFPEFIFFPNSFYISLNSLIKEASFQLCHLFSLKTLAMKSSHQRLDQNVVHFLIYSMSQTRFQEFFFIC